MSAQLGRLFSPLDIGPITVRNRIMLPAATTLMGEKDGSVGDRMIRYYGERAKGGVGLIIVEQSAVHPNTRYEFPANGLVGYEPRVIQGYRKLVDDVHQYKAKVFCQLFHSGIHNNNLHPENTVINQVWGPSSIPSMQFSRGFDMPKEMEKSDIKEIVERFGRAAEYAKEGGFDGIEIHSCTSYLLEQFLSPLYNLRKDEYGGSLENRTRLLLEVIDRVYKETAGEIALGIRIPGDELVPGGLTLEDMKGIARTLEATGKIDFLDIKAGSFNQGVGSTCPTYVEDGWMVKLGLPGGIKKVLNQTRVFAVGKIRHPPLAEKILADGEADMVALARTLVADPEWANKASQGRFEDIIPCISCNQGCSEHLQRFHIPITCVLNPATGKEKDWGIGTLEPAKVSKKVVVIGGGPAGMSVAGLAALRGHKVILYERNKLGGQLNLAARLPGREQFGEAVSWFIGQLAKSGVEVLEGVEATHEIVSTQNPDVVVVATGAKANRGGFSPIRTDIPELPGYQQENVFAAEDLLSEDCNVGQEVVIYDTQGDYLSLAVADMLLKQGKSVVIITHYHYAGINGESTTVESLYARILGKKVSFIPNAIVTKINGSTVWFYDKFTQDEKTMNADSVILVTWKQPNKELYNTLNGKVKKLIAIGDCVSPRLLEQAVYEAHQTARGI